MVTQHTPRSMTHQSIVQSIRTALLMAGFSPFAAGLQRPQYYSQTMDSLLSRDLTCAGGEPNSCQAVDPTLPGNFCCDIELHCLSLDSSSTAICCPANSNCEIIEPIDCDVSLQNAAKNSTSPVFTTKLNAPLQTCGAKCCPNGYTCDTNNGVCNIVTSTSSLAPGFNASHGIGASTTSTTPTSSPTASGIDSTQPQPKAVCNKFPAAAIAAGFFPGLLAGALLMLFAVIFSGSRRGSEGRPTSQSSSLYKPYKKMRSKKGGIIGISDPIPLEDAHRSRTDFLRRTTSRAKSLFRGRDSSPLGTNHPFTTPVTTVGTDWNWKMPTPPENNHIPAVPGSRIVPTTPERHQGAAGHLHHEPSTESIKVYSPANAAPLQTITPSTTGSTSRTNHPSSTRQPPQPPRIGSPFKTPPGPTTTTPKKPSGLPHNPSPYSNPYTTKKEQAQETLSPLRYNNDKKQGPASRPTTTFTEMLRSIDFPDLNPRPPNVPPVPRGYDLR